MRDDGSLHPSGCPIRKSVDRRLLAPTHGLSQLATSFIACPRLGIPRAPLQRLVRSSTTTGTDPPPATPNALTLLPIPTFSNSRRPTFARGPKKPEFGHLVVGAGDTRALSVRRPTHSSRKEVIQPQVPLRLPCYDFAPVTEFAFGRSLPKVGSRTSGTPGFHGVTGGVYKARERIHRSVLICDY